MRHDYEEIQVFLGKKERRIPFLFSSLTKNRVRKNMRKTYFVLNRRGFNRTNRFVQFFVIEREPMNSHLINVLCAP